MNLLLAVAITLVWEPVVEPDVGYRIKWGFEQGGPYPHIVEAGLLTSVSIDEPWPLATIVYFTAYAYNNSDGLESLPSNEVSYIVPTPEIITIPPIPTPTPTPEPTPTPMPTPTPEPTPFPTPSLDGHGLHRGWFK